MELKKSDVKNIDFLLRFINNAETQMNLREASETILAARWLAEIKTGLESNAPVPPPVKKQGLTKKTTSKKKAK